MGIDLGSKYSRVGVWLNDRVEIVPSKSGDRFTPTIVAFTEDKVLIGEPATQQLLQNTQNTIFDITHLIGRKFSDPEIQADVKTRPFEVARGPDDKPLVVVKFKGKTKSFQPVEILAIFLSELREVAETHTSQRQAIKDAGAIAGLNVVRLINGPPAASIAHGFESSGEHVTLVFDLGGSTLDMSLLTIEDEVFEVRATVGVSDLGGDDFDTRLVEHCIAEFKKTHGKDIRSNLRAMVRLRGACERAKRILSTSMDAHIELDSLREGIDYFSTISRSQFEKCCADLFDKVLESVQKVLADAGLTRSQVNQIVLVGGSSRIPKVQQLVSELFNGKEIQGPILEEAATTGAAIQAAILTGDDAPPKLQDVLMLDVLPLTLQVEIDGTKMAVISRNLTTPFKKTDTIPWASNKSVVRIQFVEGDSDKTSENHLLGHVEMDGGKSEFEVTIDTDSNFTTSALVVDKSTGKEKRITLGCGPLPASEIERMRKEIGKLKSMRRRTSALDKVRSFSSSKARPSQSVEKETKQRQVDAAATSLDAIKISLDDVGAE